MAQRLMVVMLCLSTLAGPARAQGPAGQGGRRARAGSARPIVLRPARVFDGVELEAHDGWVVVVRGERIDTPGASQPAPARK